jgi:hypothetical protein
LRHGLTGDTFGESVDVSSKPFEETSTKTNLNTQSNVAVTYIYSRCDRCEGSYRHKRAGMGSVVFAEKQSRLDVIAAFDPLHSTWADCVVHFISS